MRNAFVKAITEEAEKDPRIILLTADLGYTVVEKFAQRFPQRFINVGVAEANMVGVAAGLALCGKIPFTYSIATFMSMRAYEQIRNDVCLQSANVKIVGVGGGLHYDYAGLTHYALEDMAILRALPGMTIICPADPLEAYLATKAIVKYQGPVYLRLGKSGEKIIHSKTPSFQIGKGIVLRDGKDAAILATGSLVDNALEAAKILARKKIETTVISLHTVKPLDEKLILELTQKTRNIFTLEEHSIIGGLGEAVASVLMERGKGKVFFKKIGIRDRFFDILGKRKYLHDRLSLSPMKIANLIIDSLK